MKMTAARIVIAIQCLLLALAWILEYLSGRYMGIMRSVLYRNRLWESAWPMESITATASCLLLLAAALSAAAAVGVFFRYRQNRFKTWASLLLLALMGSGTAAFIWFMDTDSVRTYYIATVLLLVSTALQAISVFLYWRSGLRGR